MPGESGILRLHNCQTSLQCLVFSSKLLNFPTFIILHQLKIKTFLMQGIANSYGAFLDVLSLFFDPQPLSRIALAGNGSLMQGGATSRGQTSAAA